jgi:hypothetical protein
MLTGLTTRLFDNKSITWRECSRACKPASSIKNLSHGENAHDPENLPLRQQILWLPYGKPFFQYFLAKMVIIVPSENE